ncbi:MAG: 50S ribosomal protein L30 [Armatimonadota bacterium]
MAPPAKKSKKKARQKTVTVTLRGSPIGSSPKQRAILRSLGLRKPHQTVTRPDRPEVRGMIRKVAHLLDVEGEGQ